MADITWHEAAAEAERSSAEIQQHIVAMEEEISETVDEIGDRITGTLDWRHYVIQNPFLAVGVAAGLGFLTALMLPGPAAAREEGCASTEDEMTTRSSGPSRGEIFGSILPGLGSIAFMLATGLAQRAAAQALFGAQTAWGAEPQGGPTPQPETAPVEEMTGNL